MGLPVEGQAWSADQALPALQEDEKAPAGLAGNEISSPAAAPDRVSERVGMRLSLAEGPNVQRKNARRHHDNRLGDFPPPPLQLLIEELHLLTVEINDRLTKPGRHLARTSPAAGCRGRLAT